MPWVSCRNLYKDQDIPRILDFIHNRNPLSIRTTTTSFFFFKHLGNSIKMRLSILSVFSLVGAGMVSALPQESNLSMKRSDTSECVGPLLCCGTLTTPLDPVVDPLLLALGIDAANIVGSIGLLCMFGLPYDVYKIGRFLTFLSQATDTKNPAVPLSPSAAPRLISW